MKKMMVMVATLVSLNGFGAGVTLSPVYTVVGVLESAIGTILSPFYSTTASSYTGGEYAAALQLKPFADAWAVNPNSSEGKAFEGAWQSHSQKFGASEEIQSAEDLFDYINEVSNQ